MTIEREGLHVIVENMINAVNELYEDDMAFILQVFPLRAGTHPVKAISNLDRADSMKMLQETLEKYQAGEFFDGHDRD